MFEPNEFADFDVTFDDEPESSNTLLPKVKIRRFYGDDKPVWMSNKHASAAAPSNTVTKAIGWDDEKCRPIYAPHLARNTEPHDRPPRDGPGIHNIKRTQKKRPVYSSLFKKKGLTQAARDKMEIGSPFSPNVLESNKAYSLSTNSIVARSNCNYSAEKASCNGGNGEPYQHQRNNASLLDVELEMEAISHDSNTKHTQPTSKTSLQSARAFFRHLDANHNLTILHHPKSDKTPKACVVRTTRNMMEECEQLRVHYLEYCKMLQNTVRPISLKEFAQNFNLYFKTKDGIVGDGLLDANW